MAICQAWYLSIPSELLCVTVTKYLTKQPERGKMSPPSSLRTFLSVIAGKDGRVAPLWLGQEEAMAEFMAAGACGNFLMSWQARKQRGLRNQMAQL